jgi:DNA-binding transcriptional LysR family regulator
MNLIDDLEALAALAEAGTMTRAATRLRLTQSAVSKRIASLEEGLGRSLVEPDGRGVRLTPEGDRVLQTALPLLVQLKEALRHDRLERGGTLVVGVSESILASWGAPLLAAAAASVEGLRLGLNAHRSPVALERVRAGEYVLAVVAGRAPRDLASELLRDEEMVIVPSGLARAGAARASEIAVTTIEPTSGTWPSIRGALRDVARRGGRRVTVERTLQSFACIVQAARSGLGHGLVPIGIAEAMGVPRRSLVRFVNRRVTRPVHVVGRRASFARPLVRAFRAALAEES